jgi:adenylosuccinate lyase
MSPTQPVSVTTVERARKYFALAFQRISSVGQNKIAEQIKTSEATVSRFVQKDLEMACQVLAEVGLKVVPVDMKCFPQDQIEAIFALAKARMQEMDSAEKLQFDD